MQMKKDNLLGKTWIEISKSALLNNLKIFRKLIGKELSLVAVVKANAYGHGLAEVSSLLKNLDYINFFAVDSVREALFLQSLGTKKDILIMGFIPSSDLKIVINKGFHFVIYNFSYIQKIIDLNIKKKAQIHLKIETGMNRQGIKSEQVQKFLKALNLNNNSFELKGISTHFASADNLKKRDKYLQQLNAFNDSLDIVKNTGVDLTKLYIHAAATSAIISDPLSYFNCVRLGIGLYGLWPSNDLYTKFHNFVKLKPVLTWKTIVAQVKTVEEGEVVGYSGAWLAKKKTKIAVIPVGYSDGFDRGLSNSGQVFINNKVAKIIGRVAMNMFVVDVTGISGIQVGSQVIILGANGKYMLSAEQLADQLSTINYEIVSRINPLLPRIIVK